MHNGRCLSAKPPLSVIAQEINRVNGGLVLKPKLLCVEIRMLTPHFTTCI